VPAHLRVADIAQSGVEGIHQQRIARSMLLRACFRDGRVSATAAWGRSRLDAGEAVAQPAIYFRPVASTGDLPVR
jgi:hypothetical protein